MADHNGLADALQFSAQQAENFFSRTVISVGGREYAFQDLRPVLEPEFPVLKVSTLSGLRDYLSENRDGIDLSTVQVLVSSPTLVQVMGNVFGPHLQRRFFISAAPLLPEFQFNRYIPVDEFVVGLNAAFLDQGDKDALLHDIARIRVGEDITIEDNGVSQTVSLAAGARLLTKKKMANRVTLTPYSTFHEVSQPEQEFVFRLDKAGHPALFMGDGGKWRIQTMNEIADWLSHELPEHVAVLA